MPKKKYKRLTAAEKRENKEIKQRLISQGIIPPPKKPLNRKAFCKEVYAAVEKAGVNIFRLREAVGWMIPGKDTHLPITPEQVGVLKLIRIAIELEQFWQQKKEEGKTKASVDEVYEAVKPILER